VAGSAWKLGRMIGRRLAPRRLGHRSIGLRRRRLRDGCIGL